MRDTPYTALIRHIVDDRDRTWRATILILAATTCFTSVVLAAALTGVVGAVVVGLGSLAAIARARRRPL
jgi:TRAP-type mannitol/chloroaromatic compound transport system permease large subunit